MNIFTTTASLQDCVSSYQRNLSSILMSWTSYTLSETEDTADILGCLVCDKVTHWHNTYLTCMEKWWSGRGLLTDSSHGEIDMSNMATRACFNIKTPSRYGYSHYKDKTSFDHLTFIMRLHILLMQRHLNVEKPARVIIQFRGNPIVEIRWLWDFLIYIMGFPLG